MCQTNPNTSPPRYDCRTLADDVRPVLTEPRWTASVQVSRTNSPSLPPCVHQRTLALHLACTFNPTESTLRGTPCLLPALQLSSFPRFQILSVILIFKDLLIALLPRLVPLHIRSSRHYNFHEYTWSVNKLPRQRPRLSTNKPRVPFIHFNAAGKTTRQRHS